MYVVWIQDYFHDNLYSFVDITILIKKELKGDQLVKEGNARKIQNIKEILARRFLYDNILSYRH